MTKDNEPGISDQIIEAHWPSGGIPCQGYEVPNPNDPEQPYRLRGPQVEPAAAYWLFESKLRMPTIDQVIRKLGARLRPYPRDRATLDAEIAELKTLASRRDRLVSPLSDFINLQDPPFGAIFNGTRDQYRVDFPTMQESRIFRLPKTLVLTGRELARMFEAETPGLVHRHALNWLLFMRADISPPRQARIWAALDLTIYAALSAAWFFKWDADPDRSDLNTRISFRQRPVEYDPSLSVLYDKMVAPRGNGDGAPLDCPCPSPGTPRHPAYPSGHSTYSAAASHILEYFFQDDPYSVAQLRLLADNIGEARLWAGVHWRTDHTFGQDVGRAVAEVIIDQLKRDCVPIVSTASCKDRIGEHPPSKADLQRAEDARSGRCPDPERQDRIPPRANKAEGFNVF